MDKRILQGKVAVVTGATSGIGKAIADCFAREGAKVVLSGRREFNGRKNAQKIIDAGGEALFVKMDVTQAEQVKEMVRTAMETFGRIDILVNNAGILVNKNFEQSTKEDWERLMATDGLGYCLTMWEILPIMIRQGSGCVINISSKSAVRPSEHNPFYCFVKAGMDHLTRCLSNDYAHYGIRFNSLAPGLTLTEMTKDDPHFYDLAETVPLKRYGTPEDMAGTALWLASEDASYVTGAVIPVDGGVVS